MLRPDETNKAGSSLQLPHLRQVPNRHHWLLQLPDGLEHEFKRELIAFEEQANMLLSLLTVKFGPLGEADRRRVLDADAETLLRWSTRLLSARTCEEVFGAGPRPDSEH